MTNNPGVCCVAEGADLTDAAASTAAAAPLPEVGRLFSLAGRVALVTGGGSGIGLAIAQALAGAGAAVVLCGRREVLLAAACQALQAAGAPAAFVTADLADRAALAEVAVASASAFGAPDIVVHAAGMNLRQPPAEIDDAAWNQQIEVMLAAPFFLSRALVPAMAARGWGRIVAIASLQSARAFADSIPYGAAKGGIVQLVRAMSEAWGPQGITANAIAPGFFPTALTGAVFDDPARLHAIRRQTAVDRTGVLADLHGAAVFLSSEASAYVSGQTLFVDGGFSAK
jgi:NAD(P)-dependent dehydrogenase (short-subunit alcohol dehydrogenase family)